MSEMETKIAELKAKMPATDIDDGTLRHMLEQADGNVEQALRQIRQMTGDEELEDTGYKLDAGSNDAKTEALAANRAGSITPTLSTHITSPPTAAPTALPPATTAPAPPVSAETNVDPQLAELKAMFPTVEPVVIEAVLETHAGSSPDERFEKALGDLLQLTDPDYKPDPATTAPRTTHPQTNLDEEFARSLQIAEERQAQVQARAQRETGSSLSSDGASRGTRRNDNPFGDDQQQHHVSGGSTTGYDSYGRPLQQQDYNYRGGSASGRTGGMWGDEQGGQAAGGGGPLGPAIEEKIGKYAEVGKQKFDLFLNTARTKVNEFEQLQTQRQATGMQPAGITSTLGGIFNDAKAVATGRRDGSQGPGGQGQGQGLAALGAGVGSALSGLSGLFGGRGAGQAEQGGQGGAGSSWGSNAQPRSMGGGGGAFNSRSGAGGQTSQQYQNAGRRWQPTDIYDDLDEPANQHQSRTIKVYQPGSSASSASSIPSTSDDFLEDNTPKPESDLNKRFGAGSAGVGGAGGSGSGGLGGEEKPAAQKIDLAKIGMLPKRQVSLLGTSPSATTESVHKQIQPASTDKRDAKDDLDGEEEYTKSPFEN
ncbi:hypothetical protein HD553DRAFT_346962 [Filobasidium floriforme]|uniref:uncharacterized protein n=1 Tax=Filobasidium floriforme TaxID=5210 RepID=UPI001E8DB390|nr:uncharacterized protein HD553DRAFT_346962 [Filobasidium floriforme]KAH8090469.1 hypothetical protein HD553DRAFT_346962 [Filobasidium floriforme]